MNRQRDGLLGTHPVDLMLVVATSALGLAWSLVAHDSEGVGIEPALRVATLASGAILVVRLLSWFSVDVALVRGRNHQPSALLRLLVSAVLYATGLMLLLKYGLGRDITGLLTTSAVVTAVAGFALQATLANLFAGVALQFEQPFHIGDIVRVGDVVGEVETLSWRAVHLRTEERSRVVIPNAQIGDGSVEVLAGDGELVEHTVWLDVSPIAPPGRVIELVQDALASIPNIAKRPVPEVLMTGLRAQTKTRIFEVQYFPIRYLEFESTDAEILRRAWYTLDRHGISSAPPSEGVNRPDLEGADRAGALRALTPLRQLSDEAIARVAQGTRLLRFTDDEPIGVDDLEEAPAFLILRGMVTERLREDPDATMMWEDALNLMSWSPHQLDSLSAALAYHVGPVSELLVRRAARHTVDPYQIYQLLSFEIPTAQGRREFLRDQPEYRTRKFGPGDDFGLDWVLGGPPIDLDTFRAVTEVVLLAVPRSILAPEIEAAAR